ncbi:MAG: hypothetical protein JXR83_08245 [Deltaproteobacteria bacterium]|nr:hypothetical protein [Deltaproteobacteria bacterium]
MTFCKRYDVRAHEVDPGGRPAIRALGYWLQDAAGEHARRLGASIEEMARQGWTWVLTRLRIELRRPVRWGDTVVVETWPAGARPRLAYRDFELRLDGGEPIGSAASAWMVLDLATRHPVRLPEFVRNLRQPARARDAGAPGRLSAPAPDAAAVDLRVNRSDLDVNRHANNVSYLGWLVESVPDAVWEKRWLEQLDIGYRAEGRSGDRIASRCGQVDGDGAASTFAHSLVRVSDGSELALGRSVWTAQP